MLKSLFGTEKGDEMNNDEETDDYDTVDEQSEDSMAPTFTPDFSDLYNKLINDEQRELYNKMVEESEGFDVPHLPAVEMGQIVPLTYLNGSMENLIFCCKLAIKDYHQKKGIKLKFVRVLKANVRVVSPYAYYITFEARDFPKKVKKSKKVNKVDVPEAEDVRKVGVYEAEVYYFLPKETTEMSIMRLKAKPVNDSTSSSPGDASQAQE